MLNVVFMGTPEFSVPALRKCAEKHKVISVFTQPDRKSGRGQKLLPPPVKTAALELGIPIHQPEKLSDPKAFEILKTLNPDVIIVVAYGQILKKNVLALPKFGCVNIHASLLPRWRGAAPIHWALLSGDGETGVAIMKMEEGLDTGGVYLEMKTSIQVSDTATTLHDRLAELGAQGLLATLSNFELGKMHATPQKEIGSDGKSLVTYAKKLDKDMQWLKTEFTANEALLRIRALNPWPGTSIRIAGERLRIVSAKPGPQLSVPPGTIALERGMLVLGFADGPLELCELQWEGGKPMNSSEFVNGLRGKKLMLPLAAE